MTVAAPSLRDRKKARSREALQAAALRLAGELGYEHLTVDAIAAEAGVSTRTFFNYFSSKEEALFAPNPVTGQWIVERLAAAPDGLAPLDLARVVLRDTAERILDRKALWAARRRLLQQHEELRPMAARAFAVFEHHLTAALADRLGRDVRTDPYPALVAATSTSAYRLALWYWHAAPDQDLLALIDSFLDGLAGGLPAPSPHA